MAAVTGVLLCLLSAAAYATLGIFGKLSYDAGVGAMTLLTIRFGMASAAFGVLSAVRARRDPGRPRMERRVVLVALGMGAFGFAAQSGLYFAALDHIDLSLLSLLLYTYPALVTVAAVALGRELLTRGRAAALAAASGGVALVLVGAGGSGADAVGVALALGAAAVYTTYILVADGVIADAPPVPFSAVIMTGAFVSVGSAALLGGALDLHFDAAGWGWLAALALCATVIPVVTFFAGLRRVGPSNASILSTCEPPITVVLAALVFGEHLGPLQLAGGALVLSAVVLLQSAVREDACPDAPPAVEPVLPLPPDRVAAGAAG